MSITLGIYDLYAYTIPGFLYLYILNDIFRLLQLPYININNAIALSHAVILAVVAFILGHLFDFISHHLLFRWVAGKSIDEKTVEKVLNYFKQNNPDFKCNYTIQSWRLLYIRIKAKDEKLADSITRQRVISVMLHNIGFGLLLFSILQIILFFHNTDFVSHLILGIVALVFSWVSLRRGAWFREWYLYDIFETTAAIDIERQQEINLRSFRRRMGHFHREVHG